MENKIINLLDKNEVFNLRIHKASSFTGLVAVNPDFKTKCSVCNKKKNTNYVLFLNLGEGDKKYCLCSKECLTKLIKTILGK